jgi:DinB superfamily
MDDDRRRELIERYRGGVGAVELALDGISGDELDRAPDGEWSPRMVVHHLADSETNSSVRLRQLLTEPDAQIQGYDEAEFARVLHYDRPIEQSLAVFRAVRRSSSELLERLDDDDWARAGIHSEYGAYSVERWLEIYADHGHEHAGQITRARTGVA